MPPRRNMKSRPWEAVQLVFDILERFSRRIAIDEDNTEASSEEKKISATGEELVKFRKDIRVHLDLLRAELLEELSERDSYFVLFPIVALLDEIVQTRFLDVSQMSWPPLQKELFQIDDAGFMFYESLEEILRKPQTLPFIYEIYFFCINHGFKGMYNDNPLKISDYRKKLQKKIAADIPDHLQVEVEEPSKFKYIGSKLWYYLAAGVLIGAFYFFFQLAANISNESSETVSLKTTPEINETSLIYYKTPSPPSLGRQE